MITSSDWIEEDRDEIVSAIIDNMVSEMTLEQMRQYVWDSLFDDLVHQEWPDIWMQAEQYASELLEEYRPE
jgi:hypothetical protein